MDSLIGGFVLALVTQVGARPTWLLAILADRHAGRWLLAGAAAAHGVLAMIAVTAAIAVAPELPGALRGLLLGLSLVAVAAGMLWPMRTPADRLAQGRGGAFAGAAIGVAVLALGDRTQLLIFAVSVEGSSPLLAGVGGAAGAVVAAVPALSLGEAGWRSLPWRRIDAAGALILASWGAAALL